MLLREGRVGVLVGLAMSDPAAAPPAGLHGLARELALHIAAAGARYVSPADVPAGVLNGERERLRAELGGEHEPETLAARIMRGRLEKFLESICLLPQPFIRDDSLTVSDWLQQQSAAVGAKLSVRRLARFEAGT